MKTGLALLTVAAVAFMLASCSSSVETPKPPAPPPIETKEMVYERGHQLFADQQFDTAAVVLKRAAAMDAAYLAPLKDLAEMYYMLGFREEKSQSRRQFLKQSQQYYEKIEAVGPTDPDVYERLCEISTLNNDHGTFLRYAKKSAETFPYDRQYFNLALAYFNVGDFSNVIKTQKVATDKFKVSPYIGGFYEYLGRAYMKVNRDQTAERTFASGVQAVDARLAELRQTGGEYKSSEAYRRLVGDKIDMLLLLKKLHETYGAKEKLERVERQLKEAGYTSKKD